MDGGIHQGVPFFRECLAACPCLRDGVLQCGQRGGIRLAPVAAQRPDAGPGAAQFVAAGFDVLRSRGELDAYLSDGGGSRGARAICDPKGSAVPITRLGPLEAYRFRAERTDDRARKTLVRLVGDSFVCDPRPIRRRDRAETAYFERDWGRFLSGEIFEDEGTQRGPTR